MVLAAAALLALVRVMEKR